MFEANLKGKLSAQRGLLTWRLNQLSKAYFSDVQDLARQIRDKEFSNDDDFSRECIIAREVNVTTWTSFCRFGDRNCSSRLLKRNWIRDKAEALDVQAMYITESYGLEINPEELAQFMIEHDRGKEQYQKYAEVEQLKQLFKQLTGFRWDWNPKFFKDHIYKPYQKTSGITEDFAF